MHHLYSFIFLLSALTSHSKMSGCSIVLNHVLIVVDSTTYKAILNSDIYTNQFSFCYEKDDNWQGIYFIGEDNYIEIFHPKSIKDELIPIGYSWICQSSMRANCIGKYKFSSNNNFDFSSDDYFDYLSVFTFDSSNLFTTWEMKKMQFESWTKKTYNDSLIFKSTDYNSPAESDSSKNYLFKNILGIGLEINSKDSLIISTYLELIGYSVSIHNRKLTATNESDFFEIYFSQEISIPTISTIYFSLHTAYESKRIRIGNSEIILENEKGRWDFNLPNSE